MPSKEIDDAGFSLIAVTWIVLLLSIMASGVLALTLSAKKSTDTLEVLEENRLLAESALDVFMHRYFYSEVEQVYQNGVVALDDHSVDVTVTYESGKININRAKQPLLSAMFIVSGEGEEKSRSLAAAIVDWRDSNSVIEPGGAETSEYEEAQLTGPRNGPFESLGELRNILGINDSLYRCISRNLTVSSLTDSPNLQFAPDSVRDIIDWAYTENWEGVEWQNPGDTELQNSVAGANNSLSGRGMSLTLRIDSDPQKTYVVTVRFGTTSARNINYKRLTRLRLQGDPPDIANCIG